MKQYSFAYLRDYFSARGLTLSRLPRDSRPHRYALTNGGSRCEHYDNLRQVNEMARFGG